jgi:hypothetical protein
VNAPIATAVAKHTDSTGSRPRYDVLSHRGYGAAKRVLCRYRDHVSVSGDVTGEPDAVVRAEYPSWMSASRFMIEWNRDLSVTH